MPSRLSLCRRIGLNTPSCEINLALKASLPESGVSKLPKSRVWQKELPQVAFATSCYERDWRHILLHPDYLATQQIANHCYPFSEKILIINNVEDLALVKRVADEKIKEGILTRYVVAEEEVLKRFGLQRSDFRGDGTAPPDWLYYNALGPLAAIDSARSEYLLYHTGDVRLKKPCRWIHKALQLMKKEERYKVANLTWNKLYKEAKRESCQRKGEFYVSNAHFSDQMFLIKRSDFLAPIYSEPREDGKHFPRGDVFEMRVFSAMKNRGWLRLTYAKASYVHENL